MECNKTELLERIKKRLYWDKRVSMVDVKVDGGLNPGEVVISGVVDSSFKKEAALELIRNTDGVQTVDDMLMIEPGLHRSDETLREIIEIELKEVQWQKGEIVHVIVFGGIVKLTGCVYSKSKKAMAAGFCWELSGVRDCLNQIMLADSPPLDEALLWQATHFEGSTTPSYLMETSAGTLLR